MSIKNLKPNSKSGFIQGYYDIRNPNKYFGPTPIIIRSSYEYKFATFCDYDPRVIKWSSEPFFIKYFYTIDGKYHKYYPDFLFSMKKEDKVENYVVEIKPKSQLMPPKAPKKNSVKSLLSYKRAAETYIKNKCKLAALKQYAQVNNYKLLVLTEQNWNF
mgnify:CR=1 FL=1